MQLALRLEVSRPKSLTSDIIISHQGPTMGSLLVHGAENKDEKEKYHMIIILINDYNLQFSTTTISCARINYEEGQGS